MTPQERDTLIYNYARKVVDDMDLRDLKVLAIGYFEKCMENRSDEQVIAEIKDHYPQLLED